MNFDKHDSTGQVIKPGDICIWQNEPVLYKKHTYGMKGKSKGEFGVFITKSKTRTIKYSSVVFSHDPMGKRKNDSQVVKDLVRSYYE